ncbi:MAG: hypothetical protein ACD_60C00068G0013 [uncultured bacterium]|nr:MAG: hypothetical protein ACD_60C00068G0013 [uncultured bacterium]
MMKELADRVERIQPSATLAVGARANELIAAGKDIINLGVGEPDFDTPDFIKEAAIKAIRAGMTKYTAVDGTPQLKKAIIQKFERDNQLNYTAEQIIVSCGAKHSLYNLFASVLNNGDEIIIPAPYWVSYIDIAKLMGGIPIVIQADLEQHFKITPADLQKAITPKTRLMVMNSPSNPTGVAYTTDELKALGQVLLKHPHILVVTDDIYEHTLWAKEPFANILMVCPELYDRCMVVNSVSKTYAMTGWRIGYAAGPKNIVAAMKKIQSQSTSNPTSIAQAAAEAALNGDQSCIKIMTDAYHERHDYMIAALKKMPGIKVQPCDGTFYSFPSVQKILENTHINNDIALAEYLLNEAGIAVIPGSAFGAPGYLRISYATELQKIKEAMQRLQNAIEKLAK